MSKRLIALTTVDNPFDPLDDFDRWFATDYQLALLNGRRDTCSLLALFAKTSENFSDLANSKEIEFAIDEIVKFDVLNVYKKIVRET